MGDRRRIFVGIAVIMLVMAGYAYYLMGHQAPAKITLDFPETVVLNQEFTVPLKISTTQVMNAAEFYFSFPADLIEVKSIDKTSSIYGLWITKYPKFDNKKGTISFAGGLPTPGFSGRDGLIASVHFIAKKAGTGTITLDQDRSRVLANDGEGSEIESVFSAIKFSAR
ncbi:MAG: cohesin domain-containing protein [Candidatus Saccharimonadales bacterium]